MLPEVSLPEIEKGLFSKPKAEDIHVSFNSVVEVYEGDPIKVTLTFPMNKLYYSSLSQMDLYQRSVNKWAEFLLKNFKSLILKAIRLDLKSRVKLKPFETDDYYKAFWNSDGLQFDLEVIPLKSKESIEDPNTYIYFDVDDRPLTKKVKKYTKENWEFLKKLAKDKKFLKKLMGLDTSLKDINAEYLLNFFSEYDEHIKYLDKVKPKSSPNFVDEGFLKPNLKDKSLFYTHDEKLGFLIRSIKKLKGKDYSTGIILVWADPKYSEGKDLNDLMKPYKFELDLFLDGYMDSHGEILDKRGSLIQRIYTLRK